VARLNGVDLIINNRQKDDIVQLLSREWPELFSDQREKSPAPLLSEFYQHNRAWVKIGDGCNQNCSYCIVPLVRGRLVNRPPREIIGEIDSLVRSGYREVVLTGVHIGDYYYDNISSLTALLETILRETAVSRIRLSSIEPQEITSELIEFIANNSPRVCRHLHLPLQSGSNRILRLMHRPYTSEKYRDTAKVIKDSIEYVTIGADVIVGFPSESEDDFAQTVALAESGFLDYLHVFSYSDRKGTEASQLAGKLKPFIIKERNETLRKISKASYMKALKRQSGNILGAIAERKSKKGENCWGITDNYLKISMPPSEGDEKEIVPLKVDAIGDGFLVGSQISN
jgi:threonylcarbamoyladenosine tRNA methylthiotransferase MtaB